MSIAVVLVIVVTVAFFAGSWWLAGFVMEGKRQTPDEAWAWQQEHYDTSFYEPLAKTDYTVEGAGGYTLHVQELANPSPTNRYVIISHGYTDNRMGALKYVPIYLELGFNCIVYDLRGHGLNEPTFTTYGTLEGEDLARLVEHVRERHRDLTQLGLHGESLGAATTVSSLRHSPKVDFAVADCAFSDIANVLSNGYRSAGVPAFLVDMADFGSRLRYHYAIKDMRPIDALANNRVPILFIHGQDDALIVPQNSRDLYEATAGPRELHIVAGAGHAESVLKDPAGYKAHVSDFLLSLS